MRLGRQQPRIAVAAADLYRPSWRDVAAATPLLQARSGRLRVLPAIRCGRRASGHRSRPTPSTASSPGGRRGTTLLLALESGREDEARTIGAALDPSGTRPRPGLTTTAWLGDQDAFDGTPSPRVAQIHSSRLPWAVPAGRHDPRSGTAAGPAMATGGSASTRSRGPVRRPRQAQYPGRRRTRTGCTRTGDQGHWTSLSRGCCTCTRPWRCPPSRKNAWIAPRSKAHGYRRRHAFSESPAAAPYSFMSNSQLSRCAAAHRRSRRASTFEQVLFARVAFAFFAAAR